MNITCNNFFSVKQCAEIPNFVETSIYRVIGGKSASSPIPWQVHLREHLSDEKFASFCGGDTKDQTPIDTSQYH